MEQAARHLLHTLDAVLPLLREVGEVTAAQRPAPGKWSAKEIIGHLVDSAANNQQKFVRTAAQHELLFPGYAQDDWVALQHYQQMPWEQLLTLWEACNRHIAHIMQHLDPSVLQHTIIIDGKGPFTLEFIVNDYTEHLKHHLKAILPNASFLVSGFKMVY